MPLRQARADGEGAELLHGQAVARVTWHARGDYFASVAPTGNTQARLTLPYVHLAEGIYMHCRWPPQGSSHDSARCCDG